MAALAAKSWRYLAKIEVLIDGRHDLYESNANLLSKDLR